MITDGKIWHQFVGKRLLSLHRGLKSKYNGEVYCLNCFLFYLKQKKGLKTHHNVRENHDYFYAEMPKEEKKKIKENTAMDKTLWQFHLSLMLI